MSTPPIKTPREYRVIKCLGQYGKVSRKDLDEICGALNSPEVIRNLRHAGWSIFCKRIKVSDRDGKVCLPGVYFALDPEREQMRLACERWEAATPHHSKDKNLTTR
jgi:hypothetical protein